MEVDGVRLRWIRQRRDLSMWELGKNAGVHPVTIGRLEKVVDPRSSKRYAILPGP